MQYKNKQKNAMKVEFYDDIPTIQIAMTQVFKDIPLDDMKISTRKFFNHSLNFIFKIIYILNILCACLHAQNNFLLKIFVDRLPSPWLRKGMTRGYYDIRLTPNGMDLLMVNTTGFFESSSTICWRDRTSKYSFD